MEYTAVRARESLRPLGRTRSPLALEILPQLIDRPSFQDVLASRAIEARAPVAGQRDGEGA